MEWGIIAAVAVYFGCMMMLLVFLSGANKKSDERKN